MVATRTLKLGVGVDFTTIDGTTLVTPSLQLEREGENGLTMVVLYTTGMS